MGMFGKRAPVAYEQAGLERPGIGGRILNQLGVNLLGVDFEGQKLRDALARKVMAANQQAAGLLQPVPGEERQAAVGNAEGADISAAFSPVMEQGPSRMRGPAEIAAELGRLSAGTPGFNPKPWSELANLGKPDLAVGPDGSVYNRNDPNLAGGRFRTPQAVANTIVDMGDPNNVNRVIPEAPVKGAMPVYDNMGRVTDWTLPRGAAATIANAAGAESGGRAAGSAPYDFISIPGPDGQPMVVSKARAAGGVFEGQDPADAEYKKGIATAEQERYQGFLTAGQNAGKKLATYGRIQQLLKDVDGGRLTPAGTEIASALNSIGVSIDKNLGNKQAADALMNQLVLEANGGTLGAGVSNADVAFIAKSGPNLMQSADGRQKLVAFAVAREKRAQQVAGMARQWTKGAGRLDKPDRAGKTFYDYLDEWSQANPLMVQ